MNWQFAHWTLKCTDCQNPIHFSHIYIFKNGNIRFVGRCRHCKSVARYDTSLSELSESMAAIPESPVMSEVEQDRLFMEDMKITWPKESPDG